MNLFILDEDPVLAAQCLDDKRVGKLLMEACQMLSTGAHSASRRPVDVGVGYACRPTHQGHPVTSWVGHTRGNWQWAARHAQGLADEYFFRYGKFHASADRLPYILTLSSCIPEGPLLPFQNSARNAGLSLDYSSLPVVEAYRSYILQRWKTDKRAVTFTNRGIPKWAAGSVACE